MKIKIENFSLESSVTLCIPNAIRYIYISLLSLWNIELAASIQQVEADILYFYSQ